MTKTQVIVPAERIESRILLIRGQKARYALGLRGVVVVQAIYQAACEGRWVTVDFSRETP
jgi:hypothetical protein